MVPMADMLNHVSNHNANLEFTLVRTNYHFSVNDISLANWCSWWRWSTLKVWWQYTCNLTSPHPLMHYVPQDSLKMVCVRPICKGEEVFNTYGQMANWQLLHMYGFTEPHPSNSNDTADIPISSLYKVVAQGDFFKVLLHHSSTKEAVKRFGSVWI